MDVLLSIKPKYADAILRGEKKYEFRKFIFKNKNIEKIYIYSTSPIKKIVGVFTVKNIIHDRPENLWKRFRDFSGLDDEEFFSYFKKNEMGFAIEIDAIMEFKTPIDPKEIMPGFMAPFSFCYLEKAIKMMENNVVIHQNFSDNCETPSNFSNKFYHQERLSDYSDANIRLSRI
jgi:predicted transcriptional regulator